MAGPLFKLYGTLGLDARQFDEGLSKREKMLRGFGGAVGAGLGLGAGLSAFTAISAGVGMVVDTLGDATAAASDFEEANSKVGVVFEDQADSIRAWATTSAESFGLTERAALDAAGTFGNFLQAMGLAEAKSAEYSKSLIGLSADIASFNNVAGGAEEVIVALRAGLSGEIEPLKRFGVAISAAAVDAELMAQGVRKVNGQFTEAQKVQGRYTLIMRQTAKAQGDFARTSDGLANSQRILDARIGDLMADLGALLIGPAKGIVDFFNRVTNTLTGQGNATDAVRQFNAAIRDTEKAIEEATDTGSGWEKLTSDQFLGQVPKHIKDIVDSMLPMANALRLTEPQVRQMAFDAFEASDGLGDMDTALGNAQRGLQRIQSLRFVEYLRTFSSGLSTVNDEAGDSADAIRRVGRVSDITDDALRSLSQGLDIGKGAFSSFHKDIRADEKRTRFFIRNPDALSKENRFISRALERAEQDKQRILADGFQRGDALALQMVEQRIRKLTGKRDEYRSLGDLWGRSAERGFEASFSPEPPDMSAWVQGMYGAGVQAGRTAMTVPTTSGAGGGGIHLHVGTLVADDHGLRELDRRMRRAARLASRDR